jgi:Domain of unknown function (DUF4402)
MSARAFLALPLLLSIAPLSAQCRLCAPGSGTTKVDDARPLTIEVEAALDFSRAAGNGTGGSIAIDERTGARRVAGLSDLGGFAIKGSVRLTGEPFRHVRVSLPASVRLMAPDGSSAEAVDLRTDLPPDPALDASGELHFSFGGRLVVTGNAAGEFRGRIPIVADYQ